jgi:hypothetical protein
MAQTKRVVGIVLGQTAAQRVVVEARGPQLGSIVKDTTSGGAVYSIAQSNWK